MAISTSFKKIITILLVSIWLSSGLTSMAYAVKAWDNCSNVGEKTKDGKFTCVWGRGTANWVPNSSSKITKSSKSKTAPQIVAACKAFRAAQDHWTWEKRDAMASAFTRLLLLGSTYKPFYDAAIYMDTDQGAATDGGYSYGLELQRKAKIINGFCTAFNI